jgi:hypothetical protein
MAGLVLWRAVIAGAGECGLIHLGEVECSIARTPATRASESALDGMELAGNRLRDGQNDLRRRLG